MVNLTRIYTRTGDQGTTNLGDMSRVPKTDLRIAAYADANEANAVIGTAIALGGLPEDVVKVLVRVQNDLFDVGADLKAGLERLKAKYECIGDVRGMGLMLGVEFVENKTSLQPAPELRDRIEVACFERGLIILGAGANTIRWSPPLILTKENVDVALEIFDEAIAASV